MNNLFEKGNEDKKEEPLAFRMRPKTLDDFVGQEKIVGENGFLRELIKKGKIPSLIFWGPPGCGKTTLAMIIANYIKADFVSLSAVSSGLKEVKEVVDRAKYNKKTDRQTVLFIDEIHRFNKAQQDAFLPYVEDGTLILIGATTENPSFEVNSALLSRTKVIQLKPLNCDDLKKIITRAIQDKEKGLGTKKIIIKEDVFPVLENISNGDARVALNILEMIDVIKQKNEYEITKEDIKYIIEKKSFLYDKSGEEHYNLISALHKSLRDSDPDAALYWMVRMLQAGEDPLYISRRIIRFASEDIGNADPNAILIALAAKESFEFLGHPEGELALAQAVIYLACAPKSNAVYEAYNKVVDDVKNTKDEPVPLHIRNAPTQLMKELGYGKGYKYAHDYEGNFVKQEHMPEKLKGKKYYLPTDNGFEKEISERLKRWRKE